MKKNNLNAKQIILLIFTGAIIVGGLFYFGKFSSNPDNVENKEERYILVLDYGNGKTRKFSGELGGRTAKAWDLLQIASAQSEVEVEIENGFIPRAIDGVKNSDQGKWVLYVNEVKQTSGPFEVIVKWGDTIKFKYEK
ncbi:MAG: DUF4430 domain-containing protein [Patescibacteria group bacterium]